MPVHLKPLNRTQFRNIIIRTSNKMTTFSKFFDKQLRTKTCQTLIHQGSCKDHMLNSLLLYTLSNFKYFMPICILPALIKIRSMNKEKLRKILEYYISCSLIGVAVGGTTDFLICTLRKLFGEFGLYTFIFLPATLGGIVTYLGPPRVIDLYETSVFQCTVEIFFVMRRNFLCRIVGNSRTLQTLIFMLCSAIILHGKQLYNIQGFWLLTPNPQVKQLENIENQKCELHPKVTCNNYVWTGMRKYFILGLSLDILKTLMRKVKAPQNQSKFIAKFKNFRMQSMILLTTHIGIYRFTHCWLKRFNNYPDTYNHIMASFLAGICYYFYPQSTLFAYAVVQATRTLWTILKVSNADTKNKMLSKLIDFPFAKILYPLALGNMVHLLALRPKYVSNLTSTIGNGITNYYPNHIQSQVVALYEKWRKLNH